MSNEEEIRSKVAVLHQKRISSFPLKVTFYWLILYFQYSWRSDSILSDVEDDPGCNSVFSMNIDGGRGTPAFSRGSSNASLYRQDTFTSTRGDMHLKPSHVPVHATNSLQVYKHHRSNSATERMSGVARLTVPGIYLIIKKAKYLTLLGCLIYLIHATFRWRKEFWLKSSNFPFFQLCHWRWSLFQCRHGELSKSLIVNT